MVFAKTTLIKEHPMCHYHHLTLIEREKIMFFRAQGKNLSVIAKELGRSKATISRELRRNGKDALYIPAIAQQCYCARRKKCRPHKKPDNPDLLALVKDKFIQHQWSPEEIAGRLRLEKHGASISCATIYRGIYTGMLDDVKLSHGARGVVRKLRHKGKHTIRSEHFRFLKCPLLLMQIRFDAHRICPALRPRLITFICTRTLPAFADVKVVGEDAIALCPTFCLVDFPDRYMSRRAHKHLGIFVVAESINTFFSAAVR